MADRLQLISVPLLLCLVVSLVGQAAACALVCGFSGPQAQCHGAASLAVAMSNPHLDCHGAIESAERKMAPDSVGACHQGGCDHPLASTVDRKSFAEADVSSVAWTVVSVLPVRLSLPEQAKMAGKDPPRRLASVDPLLLSLRV